MKYLYYEDLQRHCIYFRRTFDSFTVNYFYNNIFLYHQIKRTATETIFEVFVSNLRVAYFEEKMFDFFIFNYFRYLDDAFY